MNRTRPKFQEKLSNLSKKPGVYLFKDERGKILYIGKAKVLRNRVRSYFQDSRSLDAKTLVLVSRIHDFETIITDTEVEALILEATLVKEHKPRYNINLKDDKSFPFIRVTNEPFPRIFPTRKIVNDGSKYFGPYTDVTGMRALLKTIHRIFPIRTCNLPLNSTTIAQNKFKVCLNYHIQRCHGPCEGFISEEEYNRTINYIVDFIRGHTSTIENDIKERMGKLAGELRFEEAARLRDQLQAVEMFAERQKILDPSLKDRDIIAAAIDDDDACCVVFRVRQGKMIGKDFYYLENVGNADIQAVTNVFLQQFYLKMEQIPDEIWVPCPLAEDHLFLREWLSQKHEKKIVITYPKRGEKARLLDMCTRNAKHHLEELKLKKMQARDYIAGSVKALQIALHLGDPPKHIEGFDISNIQGSHPVASMVCFRNGRAAKKEYRRFKIRSKDTPDDFAMMHEVVKRRYSRVLREEKELPDLILIDGGKGQLNAALAALKEVGIEKQPIIALAKRLDEVFKPGISAPQNIPRDSAALKLLQRVRDESHRFAVTYHRILRQKSGLLSELDAVPGIGPKRRTLLLSHFGSLEKMKKASLEELHDVDSLPKEIAHAVYRHFHPERKIAD